ncbi:transporter substrate-binding domain-containing protein [Ruegeria pomeroyi]|uniref:Polar amino acid uptake family ABC transporter, periplasmic substrate-binding protein, putative n=2 Tax=Ruegeria pomeroyi TaxID=89184 RepID=Q5LP13_RUEPO|nr:transporter substrate-binding domain-containing protein [Ruegeria pomeroyi]HCE71124.1 hypothetical protein [Ruegeria sp.]AAV96275.1 polar amino acid uptake family ABC transporter, periplasmic substrate-binding protein, putative [Ruegeria pomeroyi DSS-3]NVK99084.1 amino acid ABC transporter substrate-binding protein [Ruegeria pomeroyi]NVL01843.1 amino acid ABC transporter substrate-binding protein [Ruegeria pomeroyi]QWV09824.1 transporter substrate-binding domain-containing protein [Ruegeria
MNRLFQILEAICLIGIMMRPVHAETWVVGSMEGFAPFNYSINGEYSGIDVQILNEAAERIGVTLDHRPLPWKRALLDFETGQLDAVFQLAPTPERFQKWNMVGPLRRTRTVFATLKGSPIQDIRSLSDLDGLVVGVVSGFTYEARFDSYQLLQREASLDDFTNLRKLLLGRSDLIVGGYETLHYVASELNALDKLKFLPTPLAEHARYIGFHRTPEGDDMARRLQAELERMQANRIPPEYLRYYFSR